MCGEHLDGGVSQNALMGSSPHVRGAPISASQLSLQIGIIPACAGSTIPYPKYRAYVRDHPRMCGEHPHKRAHGQEARGIIPACAGSTSCPLRRCSAAWDHPRMCGEHLAVMYVSGSKLGSSPHVRGAHVAQLNSTVTGEIIPACAGSTKGDCTNCTCLRDHPRMCGEHAWQMER